MHNNKYILIMIIWCHENFNQPYIVEFINKAKLSIVLNVFSIII